MAYDDTSFYGDLITDEYDIENNPLNPESPFGFYIYKILGNGFDTMSDISAQFLDDSSVLSCLDKFIPMYGRYWGLERPKIDDRYLTDEEYRVYLYLKKCRLLTMQDLEICFNNCMTVEDYDVYVNVYTDLADFLEVVDHPNYIPNEWTVVSNILKLDYDQSKDWIVNYYNEILNSEQEVEEVHRIIGKTGHLYRRVVVVEIPAQGWDPRFLELLSEFISVKGNVILKEYSV